MDEQKTDKPIQADQEAKNDLKNTAGSAKNAAVNTKDAVTGGLQTGGNALQKTGRAVELGGKGLQKASNAAKPVLEKGGGVVGKGAGKVGGGIAAGAGGAVLGGAAGLAAGGVGAVPGAIAGAKTGAKAGSDVGGVLGEKAGKTTGSGIAKAGEMTGGLMQRAGKTAQDAGALASKVGNWIERKLQINNLLRGRIFAFLWQKIKSSMLFKITKFVTLTFLCVLLIVFFAIELLKQSAFVVVGEFADTYVANVGTEMKANGYYSVAGLTQDEFDRVEKGLVDGKLEKGFKAVAINSSGKSTNQYAFVDSIHNAGQSLLAGNFSEAAKNLNFLDGKAYAATPSSSSSPVSSSSSSGAGIIPNSQLNYNFKLNDVSTNEERSRVAYYLQAERDSILKAPTDEDSSVLSNVVSVFKSVYEYFFGSPPSKVQPGTGKNELRKPRLDFKNDDTDIKNMQKLIDDAKLPITTGIPSVASLSELNSRGNEIKKEIAKQPATDEEKKKLSPMMDIKDKQCVNGVIKDYPMKDGLYKLLQPYALNWKTLYTIDKALDEAEFDNLKDMFGKNLSSAEKAKLKQTLIDRFMRIDIPKFMPQFDVVRHIQRNFSSSSTTTHKCEKGADNKVTSKDTTNANTTDTYTPVYMLEWLDILTKDQYMPSCEKIIYSYVEEKKITDDIGSYTITRSIKLQVVPAYYKKSMKDKTFLNNSSPDVKEQTYENGGYKKQVQFEKIVKKPESEPKRHTKRKDIKKLFIKDYGLNYYDIEHALYLQDGNGYFPVARLMTAWIFGINLKYISDPAYNTATKGGSLGGGGGWNADLTYIVNNYQGPFVDFLTRNINTINQLGNQAGIPPCAWVAQLIQECRVGDWDISDLGKEAHNYSGIKGASAANGLPSPAGETGYYRIFANDEEYLNYYVAMIIDTWPNAIEAAKTGGPEAFFAGLQNGQYQYAEDPDYVQNLINRLNEYQLRGSGGATTGTTATGSGTTGTGTNGTGATGTSTTGTATTGTNGSGTPTTTPTTTPSTGTQLTGAINELVTLAQERAKEKWPTYQWGGCQTELIRRPTVAMDCSGFVEWLLYNASGGSVDLGRTTAAYQLAINEGTKMTRIDAKDLMPGDIGLQYDCPAGATYDDVPDNDHVGVCVGKDADGTPIFVHCSSYENGVVYARLNGGGYSGGEYTYQTDSGTSTASAVSFSKFGRIKQLNGASSASYTVSSSISGSSIDIFKLADSYYDDSQDDEKDSKYEGGPDPWGEDFRGYGAQSQGMTTAGSGTGTMGTGTGAASASGFVWPIACTPLITSPYGMRTNPVTGDYKMHPGIDICNNDGETAGQPIYPTKGGKVIVAGWVSGYGNAVYIDHLDGWYSLYAHMIDTPAVSEGQTVVAGKTLLGNIGSTGNSTGPHLHFGIGQSTDIDSTAVDPQQCLPAK